MKKIIVVFALLLSLSAVAQNFPEKRPELLLGKELKVKPLEENKKENGYEYFYSDPKMRDSYLKEKEYLTVTPVGGLVGRMFKVTAVDADPERKGDAKLTLVDEAKGETLYYRYNSNSENDFYFDIIGGLKLPSDIYCDFITEQTDKFKGETTFTGKATRITFLKVKKGAAAKYYMSINAPSDQKLEIGKKGVIVLLTSNKRIEKPNVELQILGDQYKIYNATFELSLKELNLLIDNAITDTRIGTFDWEVKKSAELKGILDCLITK